MTQTDFRKSLGLGQDQKLIHTSMRLASIDDPEGVAERQKDESAIKSYLVASNLEKDAHKISSLETKEEALDFNMKIKELEDKEADIIHNLYTDHFPNQS